MSPNLEVATIPDNQLALFDAFGFMVLLGVLAAEELETTDREFDISLAEAERATERYQSQAAQLV